MTREILLNRRSLLLSVASAAACAVPLAGCSLTGADPTGAASKPAPSLSMAIDRPVCLDPGAADDPASLQVIGQLFDPLCAVDWSSGEIVGRMARSYDVSDDAKTFTFHLNDATFHSGEPVTASSFKRAWERLVDPMSALSGEYGQSGWAYLLSCVEGYDDLHSGAAQALSGVTCPDDRTLVVALSIPYAEFPALTALPALSPVPAQAESEVASFARQPQGNGAFKLADAWNADSPALYCKAFDDYYRGKPAVENVTFMVQQDTDDGYSDFLSGKCDVSACPVEELSQARSRHGESSDGMTLDSAGHLVRPLTLSCSCLACNVGKAPLGSVDVRRAISMAIDRDALAEEIYRGLADAAQGIVPTSVPGAPGAPWEACSYDAEQAMDLLDSYRGSVSAAASAGSAEASAPSQDAGVELTLMYYSDGGHKNAMERLVDQLGAVGVTLELDPVEYEEFAHRLAEGDFELARIDALTDAPCVDGVLYPLAESGSAHNASRWANAEADALLQTARTQTDAEARRATYAQIDALLAADMPYIPLTWPARAWVGSDEIERLAIDPQGLAHFADALVED